MMTTDANYFRALWSSCMDEIEDLKAENRVLKNKIRSLKQRRHEEE